VLRRGRELRVEDDSPLDELSLRTRRRTLERDGVPSSRGMGASLGAPDE
jgi:hypothetical protein